MALENNLESNHVEILIVFVRFNNFKKITVT